MRFFIVGLVCVAAVSLISCATATPAAEPTTAPAAGATPAEEVEIRVMPKTIRPGMRALMFGSGFEGGETVAFYFIRPDGSKTKEGTAKADKHGGAAYEFDITNDWLPGQYFAHARSRKNPKREAVQQFQLGPR